METIDRESGRWNRNWGLPEKLSLPLPGAPLSQTQDIIREPILLQMDILRMKTGIQEGLSECFFFASFQKTGQGCIQEDDSYGANGRV
ncbi:MAG: hypothetical protein LIP11_11275 [Clostridiales bacterium]|nr:hypothetical protein [Clostridiales bacterium]